MAKKERRLLIVDDSELDREILKSILEEEFELCEAENGFVAMELVTKQKSEIDCILLDISMPLLSGFDVLRLLRDNNLGHIPVFLITAEATRENVTKAVEFGVADFLSKPFDREDVLRRIKLRLGVVTQYWLTVEDITQIGQYISRLEKIYKLYLGNYGKDDSHYVNMTELMRILLSRYSLQHKKAELNKEKIEIISKASYFCDIGLMLVPDKLSAFTKDPEKFRLMTNDHTRFGGEIIKLDSSRHCAFFVDTAVEMCLNHHERYDGDGYPRGISGRSLSDFSQLCHLADEFDAVFSKLYGTNEMQVNLVMKRILQDEGMVSPELMALLEDCRPRITSYYTKQNSTARS
ncbi:MAG: response regulator [Clostridia bacterium]|nr:response regulator [Clostridia bacterium]MBQ3078331.1 response regulator [Clostridia bacterium]